VLSIGAGATDTIIQFGRIGDVVRLSNGHVVVAVGSDARWFDADGRHVRTGTRNGSGPGEIQGPILSLTRMAGDSVAATEMRGGQFKHVVLSPSGEFVRETRVDPEKLGRLGDWGECFVSVLPDLSMVRCEVTPSEREGGPNPGPGLLRRLRRLVHVSSNLDARHNLGYDIGLEQYGLNVGTSTYFVRHPFHARTHVAYGGTPMRIAIVTNPPYALEVWTASGVLERIIRRRDGRRSPSSIELDWAREQLIASERRYNPKMVDRVVTDVPTPDSLPAAVDLLMSSEGDILLQRFHVDSTIFDVFDARGAYVRELRFPSGFRPLHIADGYFTGIRVDVDDIPLVEVYQFRR